MPSLLVSDRLFSMLDNAKILNHNLGQSSKGITLLDLINTNLIDHTLGRYLTLLISRGDFLTLHLTL